jgi:hypothetical protein
LSIHWTVKAIEFVQKLKAIAPHAETLLKRGISPGHVQRIIYSFHVSPKEPYKEFGNELLNLVNNHDTSRLEIGPVYFDLRHLPSPVFDTARLSRIGFVEADYLVIDRLTNEAAMEDHQAGGFIMLYCAESGQSFLAALYEMVRLNDEYLRDPKDYLSTDWCKKANVCAELAAGGKYLTFY